MIDVADAKEWREQAAQSVERFVRRFDESYRLLAYHAALPLVLTPELVNYLRNEFLRNEQVPWVAEVDLLLSDLCSQVGYELYAMDTHVRGYLLEQMEQDQRFGKPRMQEVAQVLYSYVSYLSRLNLGRRQQEIQAQRLAAMVYLGDEKCKEAAREIAERLQEVSNRTSTANLTESEMRAELAQLTRITEELSPQLQKEPSLLEFARLVQRILRTPEEVSPAELNRFYPVEGVELRFPERLLPENLVRTTITSLEGFPPIQTFEFEVATIAIEDETEPSSGINLQPFEFQVATIELKKSGFLGRKTELIVKHSRHRATGFSEDLGNGVQLEMVLIPKGSFLMGSPKNEESSSDDERPQHQVTISPFCMGKYPVTQAQWQAVASLPQVNRELQSDPSRFKGANRPVERVSWYDASEFCDRLSRYAGKPYRLPSEAEWEYSCRAGTTTPFHFGETITTDLANYRGTDNEEYKWSGSYGSGPKGIYREETTPVGSLGIANTFGLFDMHGNVWEWCADHWHDNYEEALSDGSSWLGDDNDNRKGVLRGGSWAYDPVFCRSAYRYSNVVGNNKYEVIGFRLVCDFSPRTL
jgi:formylglycine-generating enzyme required for sulfatase activity